MSRVGNVILLVVFWALLAAPVVLFAAGKRPANVENRALTSAPEVNVRSALHIASWRQAAQAFDDRLPYRDDIIAKRGELSYRILRDSPNPAVVVGKGDWLFFHGDLETCAVATSARQVAAGLELLRLGYEATGRRLVYAIVPSKPEIEREHKGRTLSLEACTRAKEHDVERLLRGKPGAIDLWTPMRAAKKRGEDVWFPTDTHAGVPGRLMIAEGIVSALDADAWASGRVGLGPQAPFTGDLTEMMGVPFTVDVPTFALEAAPTRPITEPTLLVGDSQLGGQAAEAILPFLANWSFCDIGACLPDAVRPARNVAVESVTRSIFTRIEAGLVGSMLTLVAGDLPVTAASWADPISAMIGPNGALVGRGTFGAAPAAPADRPEAYRVLRMPLMESGPKGGIATLTDRSGAALAGPMSSAPFAGTGTTFLLAVPPGIALSDVRVQFATADSSTVIGPLEVADVGTPGP